MESTMAQVHVERKETDQGTVGRLVLDRPDKLNAMSSDMVDALENAVAEILTDEALRCVTITGISDKAFCVGSDLRQLSELTSGSAGGFLRATHSALSAVREIPVPVIARIQGPCMGVGMELAAACDFRLASSSAIFAMPKVKIGIPSVIEAAVVARILGHGRASWLMLTGENITAQRAYDWGFVEDVADGEAALDAAVDQAVNGILSSGHMAVCAQKRLLRSWQETPLADCIEESIRPFAAAHANNEPGELSKRVLSRLSKSG